MTNDEKIKLMTIWKDSLLELTSVYDSFSDIAGSNPESPLFEAMFKCAEEYMKVLAIVVGDKGGWLEYFWHECDLGFDPQIISIDGETFMVEDIPSLLRAIG